MLTYTNFGYKRDLPDFRDKEFSTKKTSALPKEVRLDETEYMPGVYDQSRLGSCVANSTGAAFEFDLRLQKLASFTPSRLFIYYNGRVKEGTVDQDSGLTVRDGIKATAKYGVAPETEWPYDINRFTQKPPDFVFKDALNSMTVSYSTVPRRLLRRVLADGHIIPFGFSVYSSFEYVGSDGMVPMPKANESFLGGHSPALCGYATINGKLYYRVRNSWGTAWGDKGYAWFPSPYLTNTGLSSDFWVIKTVT